MIRTENFRSIGLKKTLVFYSGKAPKGIRTSWIMNEYRLPQHETERLQKAEISLCRVYKRPGVEDHPSIPRTLATTKATSSRQSEDTNKRHHSNNLLSFSSIDQRHQNDDKLSDTSGSSTITPQSYSNYITTFPTISAAATLPTHDHTSAVALVPPTTPSSSALFPNNVDDLQRIISYQQASVNNLAANSQAFHIQNYQHKLSNSMPLQPPLQMQMQQQQSLLALNNLAGEVQVTFPDRLWEWNPMPAGDQGSKDYTNPFK